MTPDKPESQDLLKAAQDVMKSVLIPALPEEHRLDALMVLSIMPGGGGAGLARCSVGRCSGSAGPGKSEILEGCGLGRPLVR